ncbi:hypothetical protein AVEN_35544-1 [Araneus ventricosus]|uniref:NYN domain-containing protein n=1 Tax=Araneus ventricosus TaxID=182803 RepID=A0A4Y2HLM5_ARAVE|nr:hypothetical protein AVEN_35544-1 [Araneus ventricosus]
MLKVVMSPRASLRLIWHIKLETYYSQHFEYDFFWLLDVKKENKRTLDELLLYQATIVHVDSTNKKAANDKLWSCIDTYQRMVSRPSSILLITGDTELSTLLHFTKHIYGLNTILIYPEPRKRCLATFANHCVSIGKLAEDILNRKEGKRRNDDVLIDDFLSLDSEAETSEILTELNILDSVKNKNNTAMNCDEDEDGNDHDEEIKKPSYAKII